MESDDDFDHLIANNVSELRTEMVNAKTSGGADESSDEDEVSVKSEVEDEEEDAGTTMIAATSAVDSTLDVTIKSEPESSDEDEQDSAGKEALISRYLSVLRSKDIGSDASSDEESIKSEIDDEEVSIKSENDDEEGSIESKNLDDDISVKSETESKRLDAERSEAKDDKPGRVNLAVPTKNLKKKENKKTKPLKNEIETGKSASQGKKQNEKESRKMNPKDSVHGTGESTTDDKEKNTEETKLSRLDKRKLAKVEEKASLSYQEMKALKKQVRFEKLKEKKKKRIKAKPKSQEELIEKPDTLKEKELMSLVFGGKTQILSQLTKQERKDATMEAPKDAAKVKPVRRKAKSNTKRKAVWHDSDDDDVDDVANMKRNKFSYQELPDKLTNDRRRKEFEQIVGKPKWADLDRAKELDSDDEMLRTVGHVVKGSASQGLPKDTIELKKLKDLNRETKGEGEISSINFHPTSMVAVVTDKRGFVSIVAVDGVRNEKLHTIWLEKMRVVCCRLTPDGNELIFGSFRKFYHVYNLISGKSDTIKIPEKETWMMKNFRLSRCGKYLASAGDFGEVHLMSAKSKEVLQTIQLRYPCQAMDFTPDSRYLLCHSNDTEVSVYGVDEKRIVNVFHDEGCVNGSCIAVCRGGQFVATGSRQGIVNIYALDATLKEKQPVPLKTINNLTTYIDSLAFNATSELLVMGSSTVKNAVKLIHIKSGTVFRNFPMQMANLGHVTTAEFSPSGGYLALGNKQGSVSLFRVMHYVNY
uniref:WD repeat-containing protein 55 homolog n=1 Tax=Anopheles dirus TaxID=7168 RepID=A0A182NAP0_9DIPT